MAQTNIVLPGLQAWAEQHLSAIIKATTQADFDAAFDAFVAQNADITVNGNKLSREEYKGFLKAEGFDEAGAEVTFSGGVQVPTGLQSGVVGLFYTATIAQAIVVQGAAAQSQVNSSVNLIIAEDPTLTKPNFPPGFHGFFDGRRVSILNQVIVDTQQN